MASSSARLGKARLPTRSGCGAGALWTARPSKRRALEIFEELGSTLYAQALAPSDATGRRPTHPSRLASLDPRQLQGLTRREAQILDLISQGLRNSEIATKLFLSTRTVDHHVSAVLTKLGVPSRAAAIAMARRTRAWPSSFPTGRSC